MKSTYTERAVFYMQANFLKVMYKEYWTYLLTLFILCFVFPIHILWKKVWGTIDSFWEEMFYYYKRIFTSLSPKTYEINRKQILSDIEERKKDL